MILLCRKFDLIPINIEFLKLLPKTRGYDMVHVHVQDDLLAREIFREFVSEIQLADFILAILL